MNKKIKVIELLNKIANGEEVPKKIDYQEEIYKWDEEVLKYADHTGYTLEIYTKKIDLNEEVEILEDNTEEIEEINLAYVVCKSDFEDMKIKDILNKFFVENHNQIEKLTKAVNQIRKDLNK